MMVPARRYGHWMLLLALLWGGDMARATHLVEAERVFVRQVVFIGGSVIPSQTLQAWASAYSRRWLHLEDIESLRERISQWYVRHGYINSGAMVPDQDLRQGVLRIRLIEGHIARMDIRGNQHVSKSYIADVIERKQPMEQILNVHRLQQSLLMLRNDPLFASVKARLAPAKRRGEARLDIRIEEAPRYHLSLAGGNQNAPILGEYRGDMQFEWRSPSGIGDALRASWSKAAGVDYYRVQYRMPWNAAHSMLSFTASKTDTLVVAPSFSALRISNRIHMQQLRISHPLWRGLRDSLDIALAFRHRKTRIGILGVPFPLGSYAGDALHSNTLHVTQSWLHRQARTMLDTRSELTLGLAPSLTSKPDGRFVHWQMDLRALRRWSLWNSTGLLRGTLRLASRSLLPVDTFPIGGIDSVRGYRESLLSTDNAFVLGLEWRIPLLYAPLPWFRHGTEDGALMLAPFFDYAHAWNRQTSPADVQDIASMGVGLRWQINPRSEFEIYAGKPLRRVAQDGVHYLQDSGIHLRMRMEAF